MGLWSDLQGVGVGQAVQLLLQGRRPNTEDWAGVLSAGVTAVIQNYPLHPRGARARAGMVDQDSEVVDPPAWIHTFEAKLIASRRILDDVADHWRSHDDRVHLAMHARQRLIDASAIAEYGDDRSRAIQAEAGILITYLYSESRQDVRKTVERIRTLADSALPQADSKAREAYVEALSFARSTGMVFDYPTALDRVPLQKPRAAGGQSAPGRSSILDPIDVVKRALDGSPPQITPRPGARPKKRRR